jgi:hypothetical protein
MVGKHGGFLLAAPSESTPLDTLAAADSCGMGLLTVLTFDHKMLFSRNMLRRDLPEECSTALVKFISVTCVTLTITY